MFMCHHWAVSRRDQLPPPQSLRSTRQAYIPPVDATVDSHQCYMVSRPEDVMCPEG